ncbi:MAG: hypothetical protein CM15mV13_2190 [uncultured marine virus]|nr:MAG: hypothetical protein CM15mV13_2190 [uncultured marine virus]
MTSEKLLKIYIQAKLKKIKLKPTRKHYNVHLYGKDQYPLGDYLKNINETKEDLTLRDPEWMKKYPPFIINRCLSSHMDAIMMANEMNFHHQLDNDLQYSFYLNTLRKKGKRVFTVATQR